MRTAKDSISDTKLWTMAGMEARCSIHRTGPESYEVFTSYAGSVPARRTGSLGVCQSVADTFVHARKKEGFLEAAQTENPECKIA